jgi:hypothetical protein
MRSFFSGGIVSWAWSYAGMAFPVKRHADWRDRWKDPFPGSLLTACVRPWAILRKESVGAFLRIYPAAAHLQSHRGAGNESVLALLPLRYCPGAFHGLCQ